MTTLGSGLYLNPQEQNQYKICSTIGQLIQGRSNAVGTFTLRASNTTTTVSSNTVGPNSVIVWMPTTADAASQMATLFCASVGLGTFTLTHASNSNSDQTFDYIAIG